MSADTRPGAEATQADARLMEQKLHIPVKGDVFTMTNPQTGEEKLFIPLDINYAFTMSKPVSQPSGGAEKTAKSG